MKAKFFSLLFAILACISSLFAQSGTCGNNLTWDLNDGVLTISGTGVMNNYITYNKAPWCNYNTSINSVIINNGVTSIGEYSFYECTALTSIIIPNSVTSIGGHAFHGCTNLSNINLPNSVSMVGSFAFRECDNLPPLYNDSIFAHLSTSFVGNYFNPIGYCIISDK